MNSNPYYIITCTKYDNSNAYFRNSEMKKNFLQTSHGREIVIIIVVDIGINYTKLNKIIMKLECLESNPFETASYIRIDDLCSRYIIHNTGEIFSSFDKKNVFTLNYVYICLKWPHLFMNNIGNWLYLS